MSPPEPLKLLLISPDMRLGGAQRVAVLLAEAWGRQGHDVTMALFDTTQTHSVPTTRVLDLGLRPLEGGSGKAWMLVKRAARLVLLLRRERPDRVFSIMEGANFPTILACLLTGRLGNLTISVQDDPASFPRVFRSLIRVLYRWPERVMASSEGVSGALEALGVPRRRLRAVLNPLDLQAVAAGMLQPLEPGVYAADAPYLLAVGRLVPQKGLDLLLVAYAELARERPEHLLILGEGPERERLTAQVHALGLQDRVHLPGTVANPFAWMARAACFVLASRHEGCGNVLAEAMASGCPIVSFDCPFGPAESLADAGLLVPPGDVPGLGVAIARVLSDPALARSLREAGLRRAGDFALDTTAARWL